MKHKSIMKNLIIKNLIIKKNGTYVDATFGQGGHTKNIIKNLKNNILLIIDKDYESITLAYKLSKIDKRIIINHDSYNNIKEICHKNNIKKLNGIFLDLGISSSQINNSKRGFSFLNNGPLDMRMNISSKINASKWIKSISKKKLYITLKNFGEKNYKNITNNIIKKTKNLKNITTKILYEIIKTSNSKFNYDATTTFYAIRNIINNENKDLKIFLNDIIYLLKNKGKIIILCFNSYEYKLIKIYINEINQNEINKNYYFLKKLKTKKNITYEEITNNNRSRSTRIIIFEKNNI